MTVICWGALGKAAGDDTTIDQEINTYITRHDENSNAHQVEGSSLYMHRLQEELDHRFGSVDLRYLTMTKALIMSAFESVDGWNIEGTFTPNIFAAGLMTTSVNGNESYAYFPYALESFIFNPAKNPFFQTSLGITYNTSQLVYFGAGDPAQIFGQSAFGFKVVNGDLYAVTNLGESEHTYSIAGIDITQQNIYRAELDYSAGEVRFYINGVLKHTETTYVPSDTSESFFTYYIKTNTAAQRNMYIADLLFMLDR
jgi:hypothetical protein